MKKRKMIMGILILLLMILFVRLVCCDRRKEIVWLTEDSIENIQEELEYELNALLKKKGYSCKVHFVCFPMERYEENVERYLKNHSADIIYSNLRVVGDYYNQFYDFYKKGYLRGISLVEEDTDFYHAYSKATWENMKIDGEIFGVPAYANAGSGYYYVFNQRLLDKYQMDLSQISEDINSLKPLLSEVLQKEGAESSIIPMLPYEYMMFLPEYSELLDGIRVRESGEKPVAENILKNQKVCRSIF